MVSVAASAQSGFGIKGGFNFNSMSDIDINNINSSFKSNTGFHAGILYKAKLPLGFAIQPELLFSQKNSTIKSTSAAQTGDATLSYLQLPIGIQWGVDLVLFRPFIQAVPYVGYAINTKSTIADLEWDLNKFQYGFGVGAGLEIWKFQLSGRYNWDLGELGTFSWKSATSNAKNGGKPRGFELSLALIF